MKRRAPKTSSLPWVGYIRVSSKEQAESALSLEAQDAKIRAMAAAKGVDLIEIVPDAAESAKSLDRPGVQRVLAMIRERQVAGVIISKLDRLTRSVRDLGDIVELLENSGASMVSCHETLDSSTASGRMILNMTATIAQWEREVIAERTSEALQAKLARGEHAGNVPYGYCSENGKMVPEASEQNIIGVIRNRRAAGDSLAKVADYLNASGYRTRRGTEWRLQYVDSILKANAPA